MGNISVSLPSDGTTADVSDYNNPINAIVNEFNGNIDNTNIKSGAAIDGSKLAALSVPNSALAGGITGDKLAGGSYSTSEVDTGAKWEDGKEIYKRTFKGTITGAGSTGIITSLDTVSPGLGVIVRHYGGFFIGSGSIQNSIPASDPNGREGSVSASGSALRLTTSSDFSRSNQAYWVTVEYTKT